MGHVHSRPPAFAAGPSEAGLWSPVFIVTQAYHGLRAWLAGLTRQACGRMELRRMQQRATSLLASVFVLTSVVAGASFHLCGTEGLVRTTCCCHEASDGPPVQLKRIDDCCGAIVSQGEHPSATTEQGKLGVDAPTPLMAAITVSTPFAARSAEAGGAPLARGSPAERGRALFIWHCSYLI